MGLLKSPDPTVRLIAAIPIGVGEGIPGRVLRKGSIIAELIRGLRHPEFSLRIESQTVLERLTGRDPCMDPTDADVQREPVIKEWESWWNTERKRVGQEKLLRP